jgi:hypothetical protein
MRNSWTRLLGAAAVAALLYTGPATGAEGTISEDGASAQARQLLRERGIAEAGLQLVSREAATWSDSSLGCPMPGAQYTQALVSGQSLRFANATHRYEVHVAGERAVFCPSIAGYPKQSSRFPVPVRPLEAMRETARTDLAAQLGVTAAEVTVRDMAPATWANADLGCTDGTTVAAGPIQGYRIVLRAHDREYVYHTDFRRVMACPPIEAR